MADDSLLINEIVNCDPRYPFDAYRFVEDALRYAADSMELASYDYAEPDPDAGPDASENSSEHDSSEHDSSEHHLTGQQLCEAIRRYALDQYGYMAKVVLKNWNICQTSCFGDIVYNMIDIGILKKSNRDRRTHFDGVYSFDDVFENEFQICDSMAQRRS